MDYQISKHALDQMKIRGISEDSVQFVLKNPDAIIDQSETTKVYSKILEHNSKSYLYRLFVNSSKDPALIITVYRTSKLQKYGYPLR